MTSHSFRDPAWPTYLGEAMQPVIILAVSNAGLYGFLTGVPDKPAVRFYDRMAHEFGQCLLCGSGDHDDWQRHQSPSCIIQRWHDAVAAGGDVEPLRRVIAALTRDGGWRSLVRSRGDGRFCYCTEPARSDLVLCEQHYALLG